MNKTVYISSTFEDLKDYREAAYRVLTKMSYKVIAMEDYVATDNRMLDKVLKDVAECDIYLGIFARRYGYVPQEGNPKELSITELEYREAEFKDKPRLVFLLDLEAPWKPKFMDSETGENNKGKYIQRLREELTQRMHSPFTNPADLAINVAAAVHLVAVNAKVQVLSGDLSTASCLTMNSSYKPEIITQISRAITEEVKADIIKVNLGHEWWSTRLLLLSALCSDYTEVRQLLFENEGYKFLGMCTPSQAHRALARAFPNIENAYRESLPSPQDMSFDPVKEVSSIVDQFSFALDRLGGEKAVKELVAPHIIENWPGVNKECVNLTDGKITSLLIESIVLHPTSFVVLVRDRIIQKIIDRTALATRIAVEAQ